MYTTILFDSDDTLLDFKKSEAVAMARAFDSVNLTYSDDIIKNYSEINSNLWKQLELGLITVDELTHLRFDKLFERFDIDFDGAEFNNIYFHSLAETEFTIAGAREVLSALYGKYDLNIITNGVEYIQKSRLERSGFKKYFSHIFISGEIGASKPSSPFFDYVFEHISEKDKSKILVVGDSFTSDIKGAFNAGLDSVYIGKKENIQNIVPTYVIDNITKLTEII